MPSPNEKRSPIEKEAVKDTDKRRKNPLDKENQEKIRERDNDKIRGKGL
jgi:hypothetical protein